MDSPPSDPRVAAMLRVLFGPEWEKLEGNVAFDEGPVETWVTVIGRMLRAADGVDPVRVAIRGVMQQDGDGDDEAGPGYSGGE